jgi:hypothetical protein
MPDHSSQSGFVLGDRKNPRVNAHFPAGKTEGIGLVAFEHHELPLCMGHIFACDGGDALAHPLNHRVHLWIPTDRRFLLQLFEGGEAQFRFLAGGHNVQL